MEGCIDHASLLLIGHTVMGSAQTPQMSIDRGQRHG
jgi:hypothetical protein